MSPSTTTNIPCFLLPQLSWKAMSHSSSAFASPWKKTMHRSISSIARRCKHDERAFSPWIPHRQGPLLARYSYVARIHRQRFSTTPTLSRDHHFDTLKFVQRLKDEGFSEEQSKAMMLVLSDVIEESIQNLTRTMVLREGLQFSLSGPPANPSLTVSLLQMRIEAHTHKRSTSRNFAPSSWPLIPATHP